LKKAEAGFSGFCFFLVCNVSYWDRLLSASRAFLLVALNQPFIHLSGELRRGLTPNTVWIYPQAANCETAWAAADPLIPIA